MLLAVVGLGRLMLTFISATTNQWHDERLWLTLLCGAAAQWLLLFVAAVGLLKHQRWDLPAVVVLVVSQFMLNLSMVGGWPIVSGSQPRRHSSQPSWWALRSGHGAMSVRETC